MFDIILIILIILSLAFIIWLVVKKFPRLSNVNVDSLPEIRARRQKEAIIRSRLTRSWYDWMKKASTLAEPVQKQMNTLVKQYYQKLKDVEKDIKLRGHEKLTTAVDKSKFIDEMLTEARQHLNSDEYDKAEEVVLDAISLEPQNVEAYRLLAEIYREKKEYVLAKETLEYVLKLTHDDDAAVYSSLADIAKERGNLKQAEEDYIKSLSISSENYHNFLSLSEVYLELEDYERSLETAQRALILSPNSPKILDFLINISIIMSDKELASGYLDKLKEVNPDNKKIIDFTERIDNLS